MVFTLKRLKPAYEAPSLPAAPALGPPNPSYARPQADVNKLKSFFEEALSDEQFKAQMPTIMKDALTARTDYERTGKDL